MEDDEAAPSQFKVDDRSEEPTEEKPAPVIPNLWFVLSPPSGLEAVRPSPYFYHHQRNVEFCPLCQGRHRVFYCCDCIAKGEFMHSNPRKPGYLAEKRIQFELVESKRLELSKKLNDKVVFFSEK